MTHFVQHEAPQRSPEWYAVRAGRLTGSCAEAILKERKRGSGELAARANLRLELVVERLTGRANDEGDYVSRDMQRGIDKERDAFAAYEAERGLLVERSGFLAHPELMAGCSLDGHIGEFDGILELKCPKSTTHLTYLRDDCVPEEYLPQIIHNLWITGAAWCDFVSFDDRFGEGLALFIKRVNREDVDLRAYELAARLFLNEVDAEVAALGQRLAVAVA